MIVGIYYKSVVIIFVEWFLKVIIVLKLEGCKVVDIENLINEWF